MDSKYQVLIDPEADRKLAAHIEFLARVSERAALRLYDAYEEAILFLSDTSTSCPTYYSRKPIDVELRYWLFGKRYRIVFEVIDYTVFIYDIQDCRQDIDKDLI